MINNSIKANEQTDKGDTKICSSSLPHSLDFISVLVNSSRNSAQCQEKLRVSLTFFMVSARLTMLFCCCNMKQSQYNAD